MRVRKTPSFFIFSLPRFPFFGILTGEEENSAYQHQIFGKKMSLSKLGAIKLT